MTEGEKLDKFVQSFKHNVRSELLKGIASTFEDTSSIALRVDSALCNMKDTSGKLSAPGFSGYSTMEIEDFENGKITNGFRRQKDLNNNACFVCHKPGRRP